MAKSPTLLIDGDIIAYKAAAITEHEVHWGDGLWTLHSFFDDGVTSLEEQIESIRERLKGDRLVFALSDGRSFRYDVYPQYKSNRKDTRKPITLASLKQHLLDNYDTYLRPRLEGDDVLGILMTSNTIIKGKKIQVSIDKDQKTIPGLFYNQKSDELLNISSKDADRWHMIQTLAGDPTDGYPGCPGIGMDRATKAVDSMTKLVPFEYTVTRGANKGKTEIRYKEEPADNLWEVVLSRYKAAGLGEEAAITQARCARILRASDYNFSKKEPRLWNPN